MKLLTPEAVAENLAVSRSTVLRMIADGVLPAVCLRSGRKKKVWRIREEQLEKFVLAKRNNKQAKPTNCGRFENDMSKTRGQRGRAKATNDLFQTCLKITEERQPISVRGVCYALFVDGHIDSMAKEKTQKISRVLTKMREEGILPWEWIVDDSRSMEGEGGYRDLKQYWNPVL